MKKNSEALIEFIEKSLTSYHCIETMRNILNNAKFLELQQNDIWNLKKGGKYYTVSNDSSLIAFEIGQDIDKYSFNIVASHSDAPTFKIKPNNTIVLEDQYLKLNTEPYGGVLYATWFDRPLSIAGRIFVKENGAIVQKLLNIDRDILMIPSLAIHLNRDANNGYKYNPQIDLLPLMGKATADKEPLLTLIANELKIVKEDILSHDLFLYPRNHGYVWGLNDEYISIPRLDDLECVYTSLTAFLNTQNRESIKVHCVFDNEEVGSSTKQGAASTFLIDTLKRINFKLGFSEEQFQGALASSSLVSADNAHAVHPNHPEKSDPTNRVYLNEGIVIKHNAAQKYTTDALSTALLKSVFKDANVPFQDYTNRSDLVGGGTLGSICSSQVSIMSIDIGLAQLAMHSAFETSGVKDIDTMIKGLSAYYATYFYKNGASIVYKKNA